MSKTPIRVLLLEDNPGDRRLVQAKLAEAAAGEFTLHCVERLAEALACISTMPFDILLSDLTLPDSDRLTTIEKLVAHAPHIPLVVLTGSNDDAISNEAIALGAQDYLIKNDSSGMLIARTLRYAIERKRLEIELRLAKATLESQVAARTTELNASLTELKTSLREKEVLLNEVHHRVKNNLQVITSLLRLESTRSSHPETKAVLNDMKGRARSMALLHESLYRSGVFASVELGTYFKQIATEALRSQAHPGGAVRLEFDLEPVRVGMDQAAPCGLLVNELVSNCLKHGFSDKRSGVVRIEVHGVPGLAGRANRVRVCVNDNGAGLPADFEARRQQSLGMQLVTDLALQLSAELELGTGPGASIAVSFEIAPLNL